LRIDPIDATGRFEVVALALLAEKPPAQPPAPLPDALAARFLRGHGVVVGPEQGQPCLPPAVRSVRTRPDLALLESGSQDFVVAHQALEMEGLQEWARILKPGGALLISAPAARESDIRKACREGLRLAELQPGTAGEILAVVVRTSPPIDERPVDIVVPIYNARAYTRQCVESVLRHATGDFRLILVNDASTEPGMV